MVAPALPIGEPQEGQEGRAMFIRWPGISVADYFPCFAEITITKHFGQATYLG